MYVPDNVQDVSVPVPDVVESPSPWHAGARKRAVLYHNFALDWNNRTHRVTLQGKNICLPLPH